MTRHRIRLRFRKEGDLRLISHRDLVRLFERLFRRASLELSMSEGFHPKARMTFPSALALGIAATDEVMEVELAEALSAPQLVERLEPHLPPGLVIHDARVVQPGGGKPQVESFTYEFPVPEERREQVTTAIRELLSQPACLIAREGNATPIDLRAGLDQLEWTLGGVRMRLRPGQQASVRPREVLAAIGLADLESHGLFLTRTTVELAK